MKTKNLLSSALLIVSTAIMITACYKSNNNYNNGGATNNTIRMSNSVFSPSNLTVIAGSTVTWMNDDNKIHAVTTADGSINSGDIAVGSSFTKTFSSAGTFNYFDSHNANMTGILTVVVASTGGGY
jgi:plastocyanin